jgi:hypothetical protein
MKIFRLFLFSLILFVTLFSITSCGLLSGKCESLLKSVKEKEFYGSILFTEFEIQQERLKSDSPFPNRYRESVVALLNNYIEVQKMILNYPECLVKPELYDALAEGIPNIESKVIRASESDEAAFLEMLGPLSENYQSIVLWLKNR